MVTKMKQEGDETVEIELRRERPEDYRETEEVVRAISRMAAERESEGLSVGIICTDETRALYPCGVVRSMGVRARQETIAHNLYAVLREFDDLNADVIYSESFEGGELSQAIMNRLCKAAGYHMMNV